MNSLTSFPNTHADRQVLPITHAGIVKFLKQEKGGIQVCIYIYYNKQTQKTYF